MYALYSTYFADLQQVLTRMLLSVRRKKKNESSYLPFKRMQVLYNRRHRDRTLSSETKARDFSISDRDGR